MKRAAITVDREYRVCRINPNIYGSFVEHMGRVVYTGIFEPGHPRANEQGFRMDVLELVKKLRLPIIRYPGGNFTSGYRWEDTVGPVEQRPVKLELAWKAIEPNTFGLHEFMEWMKLVGAEPILTLNLGTRGIDDAANFVEYCNFPGGTRWSDLRRAHGAEKPYKIKYWCLGNELDGSWQIASKTAEEYGRIANEAAKAVKWIDPDARTIAVGSSTPVLDSYPEWDRRVLMECYDNVDYLAMHNYLNRRQDEQLDVEAFRAPDALPVYLTRAAAFDRQIHQVIAACDYVQAVKRSDKKMMLAFDEWNVHRHPEVKYEQWKTASPIDWVQFDLADTLLFCGMLLAIMRHADRIGIACQSLLVNTIPMILTEAGGPAWVNPIYYPFMQASVNGRGTLIRTVIDGETSSNRYFQDVPNIDHVVVENDGDVTLFLLNRCADEAEVSLTLRGYQPEKVLEDTELTGAETDHNTKENPENLIPRKVAGRTWMDGECVRCRLKPYSWNMIKVSI